MKKTVVTSVVYLTIWVLSTTITTLCEAQTPIGPEWWPSEFGADDQRGAINRVTPQKTLQAARLIRHGKIYQLGQLYEHGMPLAGRRHFSLTIPGLPTYPADPKTLNQGIGNDEILSAEIGQVGTQFDGLGHVGVYHNGRNLFYNGFDLAEFGDTYGFTKLGIENVGVFSRVGFCSTLPKCGRQNV